MKKYETNRLRNIAIIAHGKAGKTTLAEAMLYDAGASDRLGRVDDGSSLMDFEPEEIKRSLTISSAFNHLEWDKHKMNIVDTPGDANFIMDTKNSLQAVDGAVIVIDAVAGVEVQTEKVWEFATQFRLPRLFFISSWIGNGRVFLNHSWIFKKFSPEGRPLEFAHRSRRFFPGILDLLTLKAFRFPNDLSGKITAEEIPGDMQEEAIKAREKLVEMIAESDDALLEKYLEGHELSPEELFQGLRSGVLNQEFSLFFAVQV